MSRPRTSALAAALLAGATLLMTGCGSGFGATTSKPYAPSDGVMGDSGRIRVLNALVVAPEGGNEGVVSMTVVNRGSRPERLLGLASDAGTVDLTGDRTLLPGAAVAFTAGSDPAATIQGLRAQPGQTLKLRLSFQNTAPLTLDTVVVPPTGPYASLTPEPTPTPTHSPSTRPRATGTATPAKTSATASPSPSAS